MTFDETIDNYDGALTRRASPRNVAAGRVKVAGMFCIGDDRARDTNWSPVRWPPIPALASNFEDCAGY